MKQYKRLYEVEGVAESNEVAGELEANEAYVELLAMYDTETEAHAAGRASLEFDGATGYKINIIHTLAE